MKKRVNGAGVRRRPRFERSGVPRAKDDEAGKIRVHVFLCGDAGYHAAGNITRSYTIKNAKVSAVAKALEEALFGGAR
jgi:hypothetical protein